MEHPKVVQRGAENKWFVTHPQLDIPLGPFDTDQEALTKASEQQEFWDGEQGTLV